MTEPTPPTVGRIVHYVSYGSPPDKTGAQAYASECRAAIVTEVPEDVDGPQTIGLCVLSPAGQFFNRSVSFDRGATSWTDGDGTYRGRRGGTWHWPEREY